MQSDRTFQFVSDPNHKVSSTVLRLNWEAWEGPVTKRQQENLSGRVTAACLNCRRKKIKCSGEAECRQCREKGLVCEGPPARKRPHRDLVPADGDDVPSPISPAEGQSKDSFHQPSSPNQPHPGGALHGSQPISSHTSPSTSSFGGSRRTSTDSGRAVLPLPPRRLYQQVPSALQHSDSGARPLTVVPPETSPFAFTQAFRGPQPGANDGSPVTTAPNEWISVPPSSAGGLPLASMTTSQTLGRSMQGGQIPGSTPTTASGSIGAFSGSSIANSTGRYSRQQSPDRLLRIANALETEASSLRRLAHYQEMDDLEGQASSLRLLSQQQQITRTSMEGFEEYGGPAQAMLNYEQGSDPNWVTFGGPPVSETPYQFDPSILRPDGTLRTGFTPPEGDYAMTDSDAHRSQLRYDFGIHNQLQDSQQTPMPATTANGNPDQGYGLGTGRMQRVFHERLVADQDAHVAWTRTGSDQDGADEIVR
ncbi:hypothetical protein LTR10_008142 [Elasticomyces elasticus]|nr:hypothetical protein LTR10_008142 [Elasticomyces elasticus]KAK4972007.1 hypothetical protein LTR42_006512 [Elasticomyces elasticus]